MHSDKPLCHWGIPSEQRSMQESSPESCWTSGLLKGVMKRLLWTLSSTRDAAMTCKRREVGMRLILMD